MAADDLDDALARAEAARADRHPLSIGVLGNAAEVLPRLAALDAPVDIVTDQTPGPRPAQLRARRPVAGRGRRAAPPRPRRATPPGPGESMARHCAAMVAFADRGAEVFDYGNSLRREAQLGGFERAFDYPGFLPAYIRPLFCEGKGPFRWAALSGDPADIGVTDRAVLDEFPENEALARWIRLASDRVAFQGLPARICWLGYGERDRMGLRFNELVAAGKVQAPIVIGRDHLDSGSVASPYRETEAMRDGSDAIADWPLLNALLSTASGASWVSHPPRRRAWASAGRSTPAWWSWPTAPTWRPRSSSGCSPTTRAPASPATPTPATPRRCGWPGTTGMQLPMQP